MKKRCCPSVIRDRRILQIAAVAFLLICLIMGFFCALYYVQLQTTIKVESNGYLKEISQQIGNNVSHMINGNFAMLTTVSTALENADIQVHEEMQSMIGDQKSRWSFQNIYLVDATGLAYDAYGNTVKFGSQDYLQDVIVDGKQSMSSAMVVNGREYVMFAVPVQNMTVDGIEMHALLASYDLATFDRVLSMSAFDGKAYAHIIRRDGTVVVRSSSENAEDVGYNILNSLSGVKMDAGNDLAQIKENIAQGRSGIFSFSQRGVRSYMTYTSLDAQGWCLLTVVPASVVNAKSEILIRMTLLLCGFVTLAFAALTVFLTTSFYRHKRKLEQIAYVDPVTGGNTIQKFYEQVQRFLRQTENKQPALVYINIEKFKFFNEQFGTHICDEMLRAFYNGIAQDLAANETVGRLFADNFCVWLEASDESAMLLRFHHWYDAARQNMNGKNVVWPMPVIECGIYAVVDSTIPLTLMVDRAKLSLKGIRRELHGKLHYAVYDDETRKALLRERQLEDLMEQALENGEFTVYLQPKYCTQSEKIGGAEALVRWRSASEGMLYPDEFIPLFEKNGFIIQLDLYVFEQVCCAIRSWIDAGVEPVKVSVNCSRLHLRNSDFLRRYKEICEEYNISPHYLEIELTESVVFEDVEYLTQIIRDIHAAGFGCSMDDFGSGYSSLNLIQDIPVDTIKLDKLFFRQGLRDSHRTESVVSSILSMSKSLALETVAEGVEERAQVDMLKRLGCNYIQGFYFARPMPIGEFETLAFGAPIKKCSC
ncbi:MAG: EAL domain-containing protein [Ruthenibacterium sp.]